MNALTAAACAYAIGIDAEIIKGGLENTTPVYSRLVLKKGINDATIIDDTYNAQPPSVKAALEFLATQKGCKVFVFAWMGELGSDAEKWHHYIGAYAKELGIDYLFVWGKFSKIVAQSFGSNSFSFDTQEELTKELLKILDANKVVLVKGSRSTKMENVVGKLLITEN
jgi:UDP-N-acetylmuramoyl-tripeptide--D-alanyl-D-alanine ligase